MKRRKGLIRLWIMLSIVWMIGAAGAFLSHIRDIVPKHTEGFIDLSPGATTVFRPLSSKDILEDNVRYEMAELYQTEELSRAGLIAIAPPLLVLVAYGGVIWVVRGFAGKVAVPKER
jgi:hypothetical protein